MKGLGDESRNVLKTLTLIVRNRKAHWISLTVF